MQFVYLFICVCSPRSKRECPKDILMPKWQTNNETTDICTGYPGYTEGYLSATCLAAFDLPTHTPSKRYWAIDTARKRETAWVSFCILLGYISNLFFHLSKLPAKLLSRVPAAFTCLVLRCVVCWFWQIADNLTAIKLQFFLCCLPHALQGGKVCTKKNEQDRGDGAGRRRRTADASIVLPLADCTIIFALKTHSPSHSLLFPLLHPLFFLLGFCGASWLAAAFIVVVAAFVVAAAAAVVIWCWVCYCCCCFPLCHKQNGRLLTYSPLHPAHSLAVQRRVLYNLYLKDISLCQINLNSFVQHNCCIALCHVASFSDSLVRCVVAPVLVPILAWPGSGLALWFLTLWFLGPAAAASLLG